MNYVRKGIGPLRERFRTFKQKTTIPFSPKSRGGGICSFRGFFRKSKEFSKKPKDLDAGGAPTSPHFVAATLKGTSMLLLTSGDIATPRYNTKSNVPGALLLTRR